MAVTRLAGVKGMNDILPAEAGRWERLEETVAAWARSYGYQRIRTPIVEPTALFARGLGQVTDIVEKEMYSFEDALNGEHLTLRPEMTAGVVRAVIEHNLLHDGPKRLWYFGPMFRHERPQRGRYRQFHQVGIEALGFAGPDVDVEVIAMCQRLWDDLDLKDLRLQVNSIGDAAERARHRQDLVDYFSRHEQALDADSRRRLQSNPLRILDSKNPAMQSLIEAAPRLLDYLDGASREHFEGVRAGLADLGIPAEVNPRLVRGMDYYNRTVFEWVTDKLGAQATVCGGGRYDPLVEMLGGKPAPACGFAIGVERLLDLCVQAGSLESPAAVDVYVVSSGAGTTSMALRASEQLRSAGFDVLMHAGGGSFKSQFRRADASGARIALVIGEDELARGELGVKRLRAGADPQGRGSAPDKGAQESVPVDRLVDTVAGLLLGED
ncbi:MAG: histidine--tRNA ligase [Burkholderiaceae bacterium]|nr:histidine--tRNA ligase [Burkholderiaceae bacterium]